MSAPPALSKYARFVGVGGAAALLAVTFPQMALKQIADAAGMDESGVRTLTSYGLLLSFLLTAMRLWRNKPLSPRGTIVASYAVAGAGALGAALAPSRWTLVAALVGGAWVIRTSAPLRSVASTRFPEHKTTAQGLCQSWTYGVLTAYQLGFAGITAWVGVRWALVGAGIALLVQGVQIARFKDLPQPKSEPLPASDRSWHAVLGIRAAIVSVLIIGLGVGVFQLLFLRLESHLISLGVGPGAASILVAFAGGTRLLSILVLLRTSKDADTRPTYASSQSSLWILASGALALLTLAGLGTIVGVVVVIAAATALEIGQNTQNAAVRGYLSALSLDAAIIAAIATTAFTYGGAQAAVPLSWAGTALAWAAVGVVLWLLSFVLRRYPVLEGSWRGRTRPSKAIVVTLEPPKENVAGDSVLLLKLSTVPGSCRMREGDRLRAQAPFEATRHRSPRVTEFALRVLWNRRPRAYSQRSGKLRFLSRVPLVGTDGLVYGWIRWWFATGGSWRIVQRPAQAAGTAASTSVLLQSATFGKQLVVSRGSLHR
ncbi:hypothetical protein DSM104299_00502 [Baekduia alba]|uniref:hypothetical protein n=1 Tax=Baekduia alba TaxID=2997333 RepID=UPI002342866A|nr:hypothetical protein [Baekduia alba]WCB91824.1 hypothetical protein DSM104299_00502 [Baekduia alba]